MLLVNGVKPEIKVFGNHETNLTLPMLNGKEKIDTFTIEWKYDNDLEIWYLRLIDSILSRYLLDNFGLKHNKIKAFIPYLPYERMDRYNADTHNAISLEELATILPDSWEYTIMEPHSRATKGYLNSYGKDFKFINSNFSMLKTYTKNKHGYMIVFPDNGALVRYGDTYKETFKDKPYLLGQKVRNFKETNIIHYDITSPSNVTDYSQVKEFIVPDDICSYGRTFVALANELHKLAPKAKITLIITHAETHIFNDNLLSSYIDKFIFTNSILPLGFDINHNVPDNYNLYLDTKYKTPMTIKCYELAKKEEK